MQLDENLPRSTGAALARAGHDVLNLADTEASADDRRVLALAREAARVLVTFDADFGDLICRRGEPPPPAVLCLRLQPVDGTAAAALVLQALADNVQGQFVVCMPEGRRRRPLLPHR